MLEKLSIKEERENFQISSQRDFTISRRALWLVNDDDVVIDLNYAKTDDRVGERDDDDEIFLVFLLVRRWVEVVRESFEKLNHLIFLLLSNGEKVCLLGGREFKQNVEGWGKNSLQHRELQHNTIKLRCKNFIELWK